jgi:hypothetical protein
MNSFSPTGPTRQAAQNFSERLGSLAAESASSRPATPAPLLDATPVPVPTQLTSLIARVRQRSQRQEEAAEKLRAQDFLRGQ